jgi:hypothetical protein
VVDNLTAHKVKSKRAGVSKATIAQNQQSAVRHWYEDPNEHLPLLNFM